MQMKWMCVEKRMARVEEAELYAYAKDEGLFCVFLCV